MTCEEFCNITVDLEDMTVAERASRHRHITDCAACRGFLFSFINFLPALLAMEPDAMTRMTRLAQHDMQDSEWREVTGVDPDQPPAKGGGR